MEILMARFFFDTKRILNSLIMKNCAFGCILFFHLLCIYSYAQNSTQGNTSKLNVTKIHNEADTASITLSLKDCLQYASKNQPALNQSLIDESIAHRNNAIALSGWLPQISGAASYQQYFQLPTSFANLGGSYQAFQAGVHYNAIPSLTVSQTLFSNDVLFAARAIKLNNLEAQQITTSTKIEMVSGVTKAFYDLLLSIQQIGVYKEDTARLKKNLSDAFSQYENGIVDQVDYKMANISLNNSLSQLQTATETVGAKYASLQQLMGFPPEKKFAVLFDTVQMMRDIYIDTTIQLEFEKRIEYQVLETAKKIQMESTHYYQLGFLPSLSAFYDYDLAYENNAYSDLYKNSYPYSFFGLQLTLPIFTGFKRNENLSKSKLIERRIDWDEVNLKLGIYTQYKQAMASYKSNFYFLNKQRENESMALEVYSIVKMQYQQGIKAYIDVIISESDLQTSEINYLNALFHLLESKIDLEKAMGNIPTNI
jgi:outer membrane protein TolC